MKPFKPPKFSPLNQTSTGSLFHAVSELCTARLDVIHPRREGELAGNREAEAAGLDDCAFARHHLDPVAWRGVAWRMGRGPVLGATR